ncbi:MAG: hypothetical protein Q7K48_09480 [Fusobacterium sp. JB021]|nr:hypothetical protein [Fusobacterium sp. JB021]MDP0507395.1 hypothetical protein [Fusobacterium sp. JB019]
MEERNKIKSWLIQLSLIALGILFLIIYVIIPGSKDINYTKKAESVEKSLNEIRVALEEYYKVTGKYPELTKKGAYNNLKILDYIDEKGNKISFAKIYKKNSIEFTEGTDKLGKNNKIFDTDDFKTRNGLAGWNYDYSGQTGEIHPNLPNNMYMQNINWSDQ